MNESFFPFSTLSIWIRLKNPSRKNQINEDLQTLMLHTMWVNWFDLICCWCFEFSKSQKQSDKKQIQFTSGLFFFCSVFKLTVFRFVFEFNFKTKQNKTNKNIWSIHLIVRYWWWKVMTKQQWKNIAFWFALLHNIFVFFALF